VPPETAARGYIVPHIFQTLTRPSASGVRARSELLLWRGNQEYGGVAILTIPRNLLLTHRGARLPYESSSSIYQLFQYVEYRHGGCVVEEA
jgi:hypothetical protein